MALPTQLHDFIARVATEFKAVRTLYNSQIGVLSNLTTTSKANLVSAINEVRTTAGAQGPAGATGPAGPQGPQGPAGTGANISRTSTASEAIANNSLVYVKSDGQLALSNATAEGKEAMAFVKVGVASGAIVTYYPLPDIWTGLSGLTPGASYYMGTTAGAMVIAASAPSAIGNVLMKIGFALSASELVFKPEPPITL